MHWLLVIEPGSWVQQRQRALALSQRQWQQQQPQLLLLQAQVLEERDVQPEVEAVEGLRPWVSVGRAQGSCSVPSPPPHPFSLATNHLASLQDPRRRLSPETSPHLALGTRI